MDNEYYKSVIRNFTMMSDTFARNVLKDRACAEYVLQIIMDNPELRVIESSVQADYKNMQGRSAVLDCVARDETGRIFDIEIQQEYRGTSPKRARYYSGLLDMNELKPGEDFEKLGESYVIFITGDDVPGGGLGIYHIDRIIKEMKKPFEDCSHIIYVNSQVQDDTALGRLMHDFNCKSADEIYSEVLAERVSALKDTPKGVSDMCRELEIIRQSGIEEGMEKGMEKGLEKGRTESKRESTLRMNALGMSYELIAASLDVTVEQVKEWISGGAA